ncbi:MAG: sigma 54-interacting transcriptional regulator [Gammaproteobacteria bacterium]|nr:sigma 54-interacting transcriptional regulator [Gammaproteobacteria bacterium]MDX2462854.1 sigma 54-interacting transcriptional regulator [Gammaproteobacteria bacterium]
MAATSGDILLVDDDPGLLRLLSIRLNAAGYEVRAVQSGEIALEAVETQRPDLVITDLRMDRMDGMQLLDELNRRCTGLPVLILTAHGTIPDAVSATQEGAVAFLTKPVDKTSLLDHVEKALQLNGSRKSDRSWRADIVSRSAVMEEVLNQARRLAKTESSVLISGASGTGKELLARAIHRASERSGEFVAVNCAAIPEALLESELFGHAKGAFTGASRERTGLFEYANGGTMFLDEIGDMPVSLQAKLLRVLQERRVRPVGSNSVLPIDTRVISATNHDLESAMGDGSFREDLFYRLNVLELRIPVLSERREDIPGLVAHKLEQLARDTGNTKRFSPGAMELLVSAEWPGNVRQLFNLVEKTAALAPSPVISVRQVKQSLGDQSATLRPFAEAREDFTRSYLIELMRLSQGNVSKAARMAKRNRTDFYRLLSKHRLDAADFKA